MRIATLATMTTPIPVRRLTLIPRSRRHSPATLQRSTPGRLYGRDAKRVDGALRADPAYIDSAALHAAVTSARLSFRLRRARVTAGLARAPRSSDSMKGTT